MGERGKTCKHVGKLFSKSFPSPAKTNPKNSKIFAVPTPAVGKFVFDVDVIGRDAELFEEELAQDLRHMGAGGFVGGTEELDLYHGNGEVIVAAKPHAAVVGKVQH